jgi:hypothetical protein
MHIHTHMGKRLQQRVKEIFYLFICLFLILLIYTIPPKAAFRICQIMPYPYIICRYTPANAYDFIIIIIFSSVTLRRHRSMCLHVLVYSTNDNFRRKASIYNVPKYTRGTPVAYLKSDNLELGHNFQKYYEFCPDVLLLNTWVWSPYILSSICVGSSILVLPRRLYVEVG